MKRDRHTRRHGEAGHALRDLIRAELAYERAVADQPHTAELQEQVSEARERYRRLVSAASDEPADLVH